MQNTLNLPTNPHLNWKQKVAYLAHEFFKSPQIPTQLEHIFAPGVYIRELKIPSGSMFLGREHLIGHTVQLVEGTVILITPAGNREISAPAQIQTFPGAFTVCYTLTDVKARTLHPNLFESRDTKALEDSIFGPVEDMKALGQQLHDYEDMFKERGVSEESLRPVFEDQSDMIPLAKDYHIAVQPSKIQGQGLFAQIDFPENSFIAPAMINRRRTIAGRFVNHSFNPNAEYIGDDTLDLVSLRHILAGEEITVDYRVLWDRRLK